MADEKQYHFDIKIGRTARDSQVLLNGRPVENVKRVAVSMDAKTERPLVELTLYANSIHVHGQAKVVTDLVVSKIEVEKK
jgi:hypothetical protein